MEEKQRETTYTGPTTSIPKEALAEKNMQFRSQDDKLREILDKAGISQHRGPREEEEIRKDLAVLEDKRSAMRARLQKLNNIRKRLTAQHEELVHRKVVLQDQKSKAQQEYNMAVEKAKEGNEMVNKALEGLHCSLKKLFQVYEQQKEKPTLLSSISHDEYHKAEEEFLRQLTTYAKKQFFPGIEQIAESGGDSSQFGVFNPLDTNTPIQLGPGESEEEYEKHCKELSRLQSAYVLSETQRIDSQIELDRCEAARATTEEEMVRLKAEHPSTKLDHDAMRRLIKEDEEKLKEVRQQLKEARDRLPSLLEDAAALQISHVLHGDCDLKIVRQNYITSKQDLVIKSLEKQRARHEFLAMLLEVELRRHRDTHRLLSAAETQLKNWQTEGAKRMELMQRDEVQPAATKSTLKPTDHLNMDLYRLLVDHEATPDTVEGVQYSSVEEAVTKLVKEKESLCSVMESKREQQAAMVDDMLKTFHTLHQLTYGHTNPTTEEPPFSVQEYTQTEAKVRSVLDTLEQNMKQLLVSHDKKQKALKATPLLAQERSLPVLFHTDPQQLSAVMADLTKKVDTLCTVQTVSDTPSQH